MAKTWQVAKISVHGANFVVTATAGRSNPYQLYWEWYDNGKHRRKLAEYCSFEGVLYHLIDLKLPAFRDDSMY